MGESNVLVLASDAMFDFLQSMNLFAVMSFFIIYEILSLSLSLKITFQWRRTLLAQAGTRNYAVPNRAEKNGCHIVIVIVSRTFLSIIQQA